MMRRPHKITTGRRSGRTLLEAILVISGVAAVVAGGGTILHAVRVAAGTSGAAADAAAAASRLHRTLRADAAAATSCAVRSGPVRGLKLTFPDRPAVLYSDGGGGRVVRVAGTARDTFPVDAAGPNFLVGSDRGGTYAGLLWDPADRAARTAWPERPTVQLLARLPLADPLPDATPGGDDG